MSINTESPAAPKTEVEEALEQLQKEGHVVGTGQPDANDGDIKDIPAPPKKDEPKEEVKPKEEPKVEKPKEEEPKKPERTPTMVEAWKLKVAEDQKDTLAKEKIELLAKIEDLSKQKAPVTQVQKDDIAAEIKALAGDKEVDVEFLTNFAEKLLSKAEARNKPSAEIIKTLDEFKQKQQLEVELNKYSEEFEKDVLPLVAEYNLSGTALSDFKKSLRDIAFSETYAKVPLKEIFSLKKETFNLTVPKKSSEGKGPKGRAADVVDLENLDEESFKKLTPEQVEELSSRKAGGGWNNPSNRK